MVLPVSPRYPNHLGNTGGADASFITDRHHQSNIAVDDQGQGIDRSVLVSDSVKLPASLLADIALPLAGVML